MAESQPARLRGTSCPLPTGQQALTSYPKLSSCSSASKLPTWGSWTAAATAAPAANRRWQQPALAASLFINTFLLLVLMLVQQQLPPSCALVSFGATVTYAALQSGKGDERYVALMVELRPDERLLPVLETFAENLLPHDDWLFQIFHSTRNQAMLRNASVVQQLQKEGRLRLDLLLGVNEMTHTGPNSYNALLRTAAFWERVAGEVVLIFQVDTMMCRPSDLAEWLDYDWVAAPWEDQPEPCYDKEQTGVIVGNGGISLRRRSLMLEAIESFPCPRDNRNPNGQEGRADGAWPPSTLGKAQKRSCETWSEDIFYSCALTKLGRHIPDKGAASRFGMETFYANGSLFVHWSGSFAARQWEKAAQVWEWCPPTKLFPQPPTPGQRNLPNVRRWDQAVQQAALTSGNT